MLEKEKLTRKIALDQFHIDKQTDEFLRLSKEFPDNKEYIETYWHCRGISAGYDEVLKALAYDKYLKEVGG